MSGSPYQIFMSPSAHRRFKKFDALLQKKVKEEAQKLISAPYSCEELKGPLKAIRTWHFAFHNTQYRIAFRVSEESRRIEIVLVNSRENFYQILTKIIRTKR